MTKDRTGTGRKWEATKDNSDKPLVRIRAPVPETVEVEAAATLLRAAKQPVIIAGGGVLYSEGGADALARFAEMHGVPVTETQAGKSAGSLNQMSIHSTISALILRL